MSFFCSSERKQRWPIFDALRTCFTGAAPLVGSHDPDSTGIREGSPGPKKGRRHRSRAAWAQDRSGSRGQCLLLPGAERHGEPRRLPVLAEVGVQVRAADGIGKERRSGEMPVARWSGQVRENTRQNPLIERWPVCVSLSPIPTVRLPARTVAARLSRTLPHDTRRAPRVSTIWASDPGRVGGYGRALRVRLAARWKGTLSTTPTAPAEGLPSAGRRSDCAGTPPTNARPRTPG